MPVKSDWINGQQVDADEMNAVATLLNGIETDYATDADIDAALEAFVGAAPGILDTWAEIVAAIEASQDEDDTLTGLIGALTTTVGTKADDSAVVKLTGTQTIAGSKTFSSSPLVPTATTGSQAVTYAQMIAAIAAINTTPGPNTITTAMIQANAITAALIGDGEVGTTELAALAVTGAKIDNATIAAGKLVADTITANEIAANAITSSELADNAVDSGAIATDAVTKAKVNNAAIGLAELDIASGTGGANKVLGIDGSGLLNIIAAPGGSDARIVMQGFNPGTGSAGPYTLTHNWGTAEVFAIARDNITQETIVVEALPGSGANRLNQTVLNTTDTWAADSVHVTLIGFIGTSDVINPTQPTITYSGTKTDTTIGVTVSSSTDAGGIRGYDYYIGSTRVATLQGSTYTYTGLTPSTAYTTLNVIAIDNEGNPSTASANMASQTTNATPAAFHDATGTGNRNTTASNNIQTTTTITVGSNADRELLVAVWISHVNWLDPATFTGGGVTASSSNGGALTRIGVIKADTSGQSTGSITLFKLDDPNSGAHTITVTAATGVATQVDAIAAQSVSFYGAASINTPVSQTQAGGNRAASVTVSSTTGNIVVACIGTSAAMTGYSPPTSLYTAGSAINGTVDYVAMGEHPGATTVTASTSSTAHVATSIAVEIVKA